MEWTTQILNWNKMLWKFSDSFTENKLFDGNLINDKLLNNQSYERYIQIQRDILWNSRHMTEKSLSDTK